MKLRKRSWLLVVLAFALLAGAWSTIITVSIQHPVERIEPK